MIYENKFETFQLYRRQFIITQTDEQQQQQTIKQQQQKREEELKQNGRFYRYII